MRIEFEIIEANEYHIHKGFKKQVCGPLNYLIKTLGLDCTAERAKKDHDKFSEYNFRRSNQKFCDFLELLMPVEKKRKRNKSKRKRYEEIEKAI